MCSEIRPNAKPETAIAKSPLHFPAHFRTFNCRSEPVILAFVSSAMTTGVPQPLTHVQMELLRLYSTGISDKQLLE